LRLLAATLTTGTATLTLTGRRTGTSRWLLRSAINTCKSDEKRERGSHSQRSRGER